MPIELRRCILPGVALEFVCASEPGRGLLAADWMESVAAGQSGPESAKGLPSGFREAIDKAVRRTASPSVDPPFDPLDYLQDAGCWRPPADVPPGSEHARAVWREICRIPVGETRSYAEIARSVGSSPRAVGQACRSNPWPLFVPCHRVVPAAASGSRGDSTGGYSGHRDGPLASVKTWLIAHEAASRRQR